MNVTDAGISLVTVLYEIETDLISQALTITRGNRTKASVLLSIGRSTLVMKMKKLGLMHIDYSGSSNTRHDTEREGVQ